MTSCCRYLLLLGLFLSARAVVAGEPLAPVEIAKRGKAATALVEMKSQRSFSTAFCVHPSGLFVSHDNDLKATEIGEVNVILRPGLKDHKALPAKVVRHDKELGLVLLRVQDQKDLPALPLSSDEQIAELAPMITVGFPMRGTSVSDKGYPAINVNLGRVSAVKVEGDQLLYFRVDVAANQTSWGGPVLDKHGKVAGMMIAGGRESGPLVRPPARDNVPYVLPAHYLRRLVIRPDLHVTSPELSTEIMHKPVPFEVRVTTIAPPFKSLEVDLLLKSPGSPEHRYPMKLADGAFRVNAVPVPPPKGPQELRVAIGYAEGVVQGSLTDQTFKIGPKELKLSAVERLEMGAKPRAFLTDGSSETGVVSGLTKMALKLGGARVVLDFTQAREVRLAALPKSAAVFATLVVRQDGDEVARQSERISIAGIPDDARARSTIVPPFLTKDDMEVRLIAPVRDVVVGGGGRYLILHMPRIRKLAVFDVNLARVVHYFPTAEELVKFAAGRDKLVVAYPAGRAIQRWSLSTFEREKIVLQPVSDEMTSVTMGSASDGPVLVGSWIKHNRGALTLLDLESLAPVPILPVQGGSPEVQIRASGNGKVFGLWQSRSTGYVNTLVTTARELASFSDRATGHVVPGPDGGLVFTADGLHTSELKTPNMSSLEGQICLPAAHGPFCLSLGIGNSNRLSVYLVGEAQPIHKFADLDSSILGPMMWKEPVLLFDRRFHLIPDAKLLVLIPASNDRLVLKRFDPEEALQKSGLNYLVVTSQPVPTLRKGSLFLYQISVKSKQGGVTYRLDSGPPGMELSPSGLVRWPVPRDYADKLASAIVVVRDASNQERFHTFSLTAIDPPRPPLRYPPYIPAKK
jgi:hypothetical protein